MFKHSNFAHYFDYMFDWELNTVPNLNYNNIVPPHWELETYEFVSVRQIDLFNVIEDPIKDPEILLSILEESLSLVLTIPDDSEDNDDNEVPQDYEDINNDCLEIVENFIDYKENYFLYKYKTEVKSQIFFNKFKGEDILLLSIALGVYFLILQGYEYATVPFHINDSAFGSVFYMLTGLHGLHVIVGVGFLSVILVRNLFGITSWTNTGLLCGTWYWHFVDVIWIILYIVIYLIPYIMISPV